MSTFWLLSFWLLSFLTQATQAPARALEIYYVDVEGGAATLIVTPAGESVLIDAGWPGFEGRDAKRIEAAMKQAGISAIDHMIVTHYHTDHFGGVPELARKVKINRFYDHGAMSELAEDKDFAAKYAAYQAVTGGKSVTLKPGSVIALKTAPGTPPITLRCLAARGAVIEEGGMAAAPNRECAKAVEKPVDNSDNARSIVMILRYGGFDFLDTGDLTWNVEQRLACPRNLIGEVDLYQVGHHGMDTSNNLVLLRSILPTVAIMNNGPRKGGSAEVIKNIQGLPLLADLYQVHRNIAISADQNVAEEFIANPGDKEDAGAVIRVVVDPKLREFRVINGRTGVSRNYPIK